MDNDDSQVICLQVVSRSPAAVSSSSSSSSESASSSVQRCDCEALDSPAAATFNKQPDTSVISSSHIGREQNTSPHKPLGSYAVCKQTRRDVRPYWARFAITHCSTFGAMARQSCPQQLVTYSTWRKCSQNQLTGVITFTYSKWTTHRHVHLMAP